MEMTLSLISYNFFWLLAQYWHLSEINIYNYDGQLQFQHGEFERPAEIVNTDAFVS